MSICESIRLLIPRGHFAQTATTIGLSQNSLFRALKNNSLTVAQLNKLLPHLHKTPRNFLKPEVLDLFAPDPWEPSGRPRVVRDLVSLANSIQPGSPQSYVLECSGDQVFDKGCIGRVENLNPSSLLQYLHQLDNRRFEDPQSSLTDARTIAVRVIPKAQENSAHLFAVASGVIASAYRMMGDFYVANASLRLAITVAWRASLSLAEARLYRRAAHLFKDRFHYDSSLTALTAAARIYQQTSDFENLAKTTATQGLILRAAGRYNRAIATLDRALASLSSADSLRLLAVNSSLAACYTEVSQFEKAGQHLSEAKRYLPSNQTLNRAILLVEEARLALATGRLELACDFYQEARPLFPNPLSRASVTVDLLFTMLKLERNSTEIRREAIQLQLVLEFLPNSPQIVAIQKALQRLLAADKLRKGALAKVLAQTASSALTY